MLIGNSYMSLKIALQRIEECRHSHSIELDLSKLELAEIPDEVFGLVWLEKLNVSGNPFGAKGNITVIPTRIKKLKNLIYLDLSYNQINNLAPLALLQCLKEIDFASNQVDDLAPLSLLTQLQEIDCSYNKIHSLFPLVKLKKLRKINCSTNKIKDLIAIQNIQSLEEIDCSSNLISSLKPVSSLSQLRYLDCSSSPFFFIAYRQKLDLLQELNRQLIKTKKKKDAIKKLKKLKKLKSNIEDIKVYYNSIRDLTPIYQQIISGRLKYLKVISNESGYFKTSIKNLPIALLSNDNCAKKLQTYWLDLEKGKIKQQKLKIQLIGNGRVGKTTLAYALEHKQPAPESFKSTHGIVIKEITQSIEEQMPPVSLQLWDFGGQEIYHATHRLFFSPDCLYLLLWAEETEEDNDETNHPVSYWLESIYDLARNSPVILVKNQIDRSDKQANAEPPNLNTNIAGYTQIRQSVKVSALKYQGMNSLRGAIQDVISELGERIFVDMPTSWLAVQDGLKQRLSQKSISLAHFQQLCAKEGVSNADVLVEFLHKTGEVFYKKGSFQNWVIVDQNWIVDAVYRLYDPKEHRGMIERMKGQFLGDDAHIFWSDVDETEHIIYLDFMKSCGICYEPDHKWGKKFSERLFILPALLPETSTEKMAWGEVQKDDWRLEVTYPFLHRSIIERLIMSLGEQYQGSPWRHGIFCQTEHGQLLLSCEYIKKTSNHGSLIFCLRGIKLSPLLAQLRKLIHKVSPHPRYQEYLSIPDKPEIKLPPFSEKEEFSGVLKTRDNQEIASYDFADILKINPVESIQETQPIPSAIKLFISYSHADEEYKNELELCLKNIKRRYHLLEYWDDRQLFVGELVDKQILECLEAADIVVLLISRSFFASDYCFSIEMERALQQFEQGKNIVIPIIIRETADWHDFDIGKLTALPTDGKPLDDWTHSDKFWADIQRGIRRQVEKLQAKL